MYLPKKPVRYPASLSQVAIVDRSPRLSLNLMAPPSGNVLCQMSWLWVYLPVRMLARLGHQTGVSAKALAKVTPWSTSSSLTIGM